LDGVGVFEKRHGEAGLFISLVSGLAGGLVDSLAGGLLGFQGDLLALPFFVKETEALFAQGRGAALGAISFDVSATRDVNVVEHEEYPSSSIFWNQRDTGRGRKSLSLKDLHGKSGKQRR